jgi:creatinine amidohydrolase
MTAFPAPYWIDMTSRDFDGEGTRDWIAVLPTAAIEQHGPHLPVSTDFTINTGLVERVVRARPKDLPLTFLPVQAIGKSNEHIRSPGTLTLGWETYAKLLIDIGDSVARAGVRKLILANSHGGNIAVNDIVAREMRVRHGMICVSMSWARLGQPDGVFTPFERDFGIHGGEMETSVMLALTPETVRMDKAKSFRSLQEKLVTDGKQLRAHGPNAFGWLAQDLNPEGVVGDAALATADKGKASLDTMAERFLQLVREVYAFDLSRLAQDLARGPGKP